MTIWNLCKKSFKCDVAGHCGFISLEMTKVLRKISPMRKCLIMMNFPPHFLVLLFKTAFHLNPSTKFALLGLNLFIFWKASISSMILLGFSDFGQSNRLENPVAIYPSMTVHPAMSLCPLVGWLVGRSPFYFFGVFELFEHTAPAQMPWWPSPALLLPTRTRLG